MPRINSLNTAGQKIDSIPVQLSYQIIKHFSAGLYTSPNKAIEELVANSYDAWATHVHVIIPDNLSASEATIWVIDNGESMNVDGFKELWMIGESTRRDPDRESKERPPIGKFGIGKLATYVLARELTYVCKHDRKYRAVTMDFAKLEDNPEKRTHKLSVRLLSLSEAKAALRPISQQDNKDIIMLFGSNAASSWTVAAMSNLTKMAMKLSAGRLKRVLKTALPISPQFNLYYNSEKLVPEKIKRPIIEEWIIGKNDKVAEEMDFEEINIGKSKKGVSIPELGAIWGKCQIFEDPLPGGKAEVWGRSHGFFVMVRGRLINLHDELFGLEALSHGAFSRFRMVVHADGLDEYLRATREAVSEDEEGVISFRKYIKAKFNEARGVYNTWLVEEEVGASLSRRVSKMPRSLSRRPLVNAVRRLLNGEIDNLILTEVPYGLEENEKEALMADLSATIEDEDFFKEVSFEPLGVEYGLAIFDAGKRCFKVNILHPFFANYCEHSRSHEAFQLLAITEVLTEAYLLEEKVSPEQVRIVINRRDRFLRELVFGTQLAAPLVAQLLDENRSDPKGLETAVYEGMKSLGFEVTKLGRKGKPDGIALARMGIRNTLTGESESYQVTYDAKSSSSERISAKGVNFGTITQHRKDWNANYALVVAPGFEGDGEIDSNATKQAEEFEVTLITIEDFIRLVWAASTRPLGFRRIRDEFFEECRGMQDARNWVDSVLEEKAEKTPIPDILDVIWEMQSDLPESPTFEAVRERLASKKEEFCSVRSWEIKEWMESLRRIERNLITIEDNRVYIDNPPDKILEKVLGQASRAPKDIIKGSMYSNLLNKKTAKKVKKPEGHKRS